MYVPMQVIQVSVVGVCEVRCTHCCYREWGEKV